MPATSAPEPGSRLDRLRRGATDDVGRAKGLVTRLQGLRPYRAYQRYNAANGGLLAGGIAFTALFSIAAVLTIVWTVFMATLGGDPVLRSQVVAAVNRALPGVLEDGSGAGMIDPDQLVLDSSWQPASIVAALVLLWTAVGLMSSIRSAVQAMFGIVAPVGNVVAQKARDLAGFVGAALAVVASAVLGTAASTLGDAVAGWLGLEHGSLGEWLARLGGFVAAIALATMTFAFLVRVTAQVRPPRRDLWAGALIAGVACHAVLTLGTSAVSSVSDNVLLAASAGLATLLLFVNLLSRILLVAAAFTADPPAPARPATAAQVHFDERPNYVTLAAPHTLTWRYQDVTGQLDVDTTITEDEHDAARPPTANVADRAERAVARVREIRASASRR